MKTLFSSRLHSSFAVVLFCFATVFQAAGQDHDNGLPGDHFSLEGALELLKGSESLEVIEKHLNTEQNHINNLDLNQDGKVDYIRVIDHAEEDVHAVVLQVALSENESQDIAVIEIEKTGPESAILQIMGDEALYGPDHRIEPYEEAGQGGKGGPNPADLEITRVVVNVWFWPCIRFIYAPHYRIWVSPYRWGRYPQWWIAWHPHPWAAFHSRGLHYKSGFRIVSTHRLVRAHQLYTPRRTTSKLVISHSVRKPEGTRASRTTATHTRKTVKAGKKASATRTTTRAVKKTPHGTVAGKKTTTKVQGKTSRGTTSGRKTTTRAVAKGKRGGVAGKKTSKTVKKQKRN